MAVVLASDAAMEVCARVKASSAVFFSKMVFLIVPGVYVIKIIIIMLYFG